MNFSKKNYEHYKNNNSFVSKNLKTIVTKTTLIFLLTIVLGSCSSNDDTATGFSSLTEKETFSIEMKGRHPTIGDIDSKVEILKELNIGGNQITLKAKEGVGSHDLTIIIHLPANKTASGKKESIGIVLYNEDETDIWNVTDTYFFTRRTFLKQRASIDYILEGNGFYDYVDAITDHNVSIQIVDGRLIGTFDNVPAKYSSTNDFINISGTFDADLSRLNQ